MALPTKAEFLANVPFVSPPADEDCAICYEPFEAQPVYGHGGDLSDEVGHRAVQTPCNHVLGESCLVRILEGRAWCPMCRQDFCEPEPTYDSGEDDEDEDELFSQQERDTLDQDLHDLNLTVPRDDEENRHTLVQLYATLSFAQNSPYPDLEVITLLQRKITTLNHGRLVRWMEGRLAVDPRDFSGFSFGIVSKSTIPPDMGDHQFSVDANRMGGWLTWYFKTCLDAALEHLGAHPVATPRPNNRTGPGDVPIILHPVTLRLIDSTVRFLRDAEVLGSLYTPNKMRSKVQDLLYAQLDRDLGFHPSPDAYGLEGVVMWDLTELVALAHCGRPVRMCVGYGGSLPWVTYTPEEVRGEGEEVGGKEDA